jgi:hypothetical protein
MIKTISGNGTTDSRSAWFHKESISRATQAAGEQVS